MVVGSNCGVCRISASLVPSLTDISSILRFQGGPFLAICRYGAGSSGNFAPAVAPGQARAASSSAPAKTKRPRAAHSKRRREACQGGRVAAGLGLPVQGNMGAWERSRSLGPHLKASGLAIGSNRTLLKCIVEAICVSRTWVSRMLILYFLDFGTWFLYCWVS